MKFKLKQYLYPLKILKLFYRIKKSEFYSEQQLKTIQDKKLQDLIEHAYHHVPYYRILFDENNISPKDIQNTDDLKKIPVLTKQILRERYQDLIADDSNKYNPYINKTSGSTGTPLRFVQDKNTSIARFAFFWRAKRMAGYRPYMRWAQIDQMHLQENGKLWGYSLVLNSLQIAAEAINDKTCEKIFNKLIRFKPKIIRGYPSAIYLLANYAHRNNRRYPHKLKSIITYSETLHDFQRALIENVFGCQVYDFYTMWEGVCLISECSHQIKHQHADFSYMELLDENNQRVAIGEKGEITATAFYNVSMPFIRYKTGDIAVLSGEKCDCGRKHPVVKSIDGRIEDVIITPDGSKLVRLDQIFKVAKGFNYAQIIQNNKDAVDILLVKNSNFSEDTLKSITEEFHKRGGQDLKINFKFVDDIKPGKNSKRRLVVNNLLANSSQ